MDELITLRARLAQQEEQLKAVYRIGQSLYSKVDLRELVQEALTVSLETVRATAGTIFLYDPRKDRLVFEYVIGEKAPLLIGKSIGANEGIAGEVFQSSQPTITADVSLNRHHTTRIDEATAFTTRNIATVPIKSLDRPPIGVLQALNKAPLPGPSESGFDTNDLEILGLVAALTATLIENARLHEEARLAVVAHRLGDISHDVKNMLTPITGGAHTLHALLTSFYQEVEEIARSEAASEADRLLRIQESVRSLQEFTPEMVDMILDMSVNITDRMREIADCVKGIVTEPQFEKRNVNEIVARALQPLQVVAQRGGVALIAEYGDPPPILIDPRFLYNAIYNLVNNAIPETPAGGKITVATSDAPEEASIRIDVSDTGRGIPPEILCTLFTDQTRSTKATGTGLGTQIVKRAVDVHQGRITVESRAGEGTTFRIRLPRRG
ncbi:MAG: GAF domain-containing sensor histidine kinase [Armatimonadetes bacterium]|nr:GAF domain-containing sensor histidine kinase [Armatimonadota bacterium]